MDIISLILARALDEGSDNPSANDVSYNPSTSTGLTSTDVQGAIDELSERGGLRNRVVNSLPTTGEEGIMYYVPNNSHENENIYDEYIWLDDNNDYEKLGSTEIDLSGYLKSESIADPYDETQTYEINDYVTYRGNLYKCNTAVTNPESIDLNKWTKIIVMGEIPTQLAQLSEDSTHRLVTDTEKQTWNNKSDFSGSYNDLTNKPQIDDELSNNSTNAVQNKVIKSAIDNKEDKFTETNVNDVYLKKIIPENQYTEKLKKIIGASVVWNQLMPISSKESGTVSSIEVTNNNDGSYTLNGTWDNTAFNAWLLGNYNQTTEVFRFVANHIYITNGLNFYNKTTSKTANALLDKTLFVKFTEDTIITGIKTANPSTASQTFTNYKIYPMIFDLTAMFGSTIAEYVRTLETAQAGSGIAWLKYYGYFTKEYYSYSDNTIQSVNVSEKINTHLGEDFYNSTGTTTTSSSGMSVTILSKNSLKVTSTGANYPSSKQLLSLYNLIQGHTYKVSATPTFTSGDVRLIVRNSSNNIKASVNCPTSGQEYSFQFTYNSTDHNYLSFLANYNSPNNVTCTFSNIKFQEIIPTEYPLDHTELRGLPYLDSGELKYDGDEYTSSGEENVNFVELQLDGSENWIKRTTDQYPYFAYKIGENGYVVTESCICDKYETVGIRGGNQYIGITVFNSNAYDGAFIAIRPSDYSTLSVEDFKTRLSNNPIKIVFKVTTATTATLTPYTSFQPIEGGGTEEFIDYGVEQGTRDVAIPCGVEASYYNDASFPLVTEYVDTAIQNAITDVLNASY